MNYQYFDSKTYVRVGASLIYEKFLDFFPVWQLIENLGNLSYLSHFPFQGTD